MILDQTPYKLEFSSIIKPVVSAEKDKYLAKASLEDLRAFIPKIDEGNIDLLPFSTDAYVVNHVNLNGSVADAATAVETAKLFIYKQVNVDHDREKVVGVILTVGFSEFGTNKPLTEDEARKMTSPFNVTVGGVLWRVVNEKLTDLLEDTNNPNSENYQKISASYEMAFDEFDIAVLPEGSRNLEDGEIITKGEEKAKLSKKLKSFGGNGKLEDGSLVALVLRGQVTPLGIGLTETPAAAVKGLAVPEDMVEMEDDANIKITEKLAELDMQLQESAKNLANALEKISQLEKSTVIDNNVTKNMKITSLKDITDEAIEKKVVTASVISELVENELKSQSEQWAKEKSEKEQAIKSAQDKATELENSHKQTAAELAEVKKALTALQEEKAAKEAQEVFNARMTSFDDKYELTDADRKVIASQIKGLDNEAFASYEKNLEVLLNAKDKAVIAENKKKLEEAAKTKQEDKASTTTENPETVIDQTLDKSKVTTSTVPATTEPAAKTLKEKYAAAFAEDQFIVTK